MDKRKNMLDLSSEALEGLLSFRKVSTSSQSTEKNEAACSYLLSKPSSKDFQVSIVENLTLCRLCDTQIFTSNTIRQIGTSGSCTQNKFSYYFFDNTKSQYVWICEYWNSIHPSVSKTIEFDDF